MPKKIPIIEKREWLHDYEEGKSEAAIASRRRRDIRVIKKGIEEARRERVANLARADLVKEALRSHNEKLLNIIREILPALKPPASTQPVPWKWQISTSSIPIEGGKAEYEYWEQPKVFTIALDVESKAEWEFFQEHIKTDRLWKLINQWKKVLASHLESRMVMKRSLEKLLENEGEEDQPKYVLVDKPVDGAFIYSHSIDSLFQPAIQRMLGLANTGDLEDNIVADTNNGDIRYGGTALAHAPGEKQKYREHILDSVNKLLQMHTEVRNIINTHKATEDLSTKAKRAAEEIYIMGLVPGQCRICRRLGM